jgi:hypothetical protein
LAGDGCFPAPFRHLSVFARDTITEADFFVDDKRCIGGRRQGSDAPLEGRFPFALQLL